MIHARSLLNEFFSTPLIDLQSSQKTHRFSYTCFREEGQQANADTVIVVADGMAEEKKRTRDSHSSPVFSQRQVHVFFARKFQAPKSSDSILIY
jgi:hypothetical protein